MNESYVEDVFFLTPTGKPYIVKTEFLKDKLSKNLALSRTTTLEGLAAIEGLGFKDCYFGEYTKFKISPGPTSEPVEIPLKHLELSTLCPITNFRLTPELWIKVGIGVAKLSCLNASNLGNATPEERRRIYKLFETKILSMDNGAYVWNPPHYKKPNQVIWDIFKNEDLL